MVSIGGVRLEDICKCEENLKKLEENGRDKGKKNQKEGVSSSKNEDLSEVKAYSLKRLIQLQTSRSPNGNNLRPVRNLEVQVKQTAWFLNLIGDPKIYKLTSPFRFQHPESCLDVSLARYKPVKILVDFEENSGANPFQQLSSKGTYYGYFVMK